MNFSNGAVMSKNDGGQDRQILIDHFDEHVGVQLLRQLRKSHNFGFEYGQFTAPAAEAQTAAMRRELFRDFRRELPQQIGFNGVFTPKFFMKAMTCDRHGRALADQDEHADILVGKHRGGISGSDAYSAKGFALPQQRSIHSGFYAAQRDTFGVLPSDLPFPDEGFAISHSAAEKRFT